MGFPNRDNTQQFPSLRSQSGQGLIEYILVLVVTIGIVLGGVYQLNTAFKKWATNYFGNYLACLLETGELPSVGGGPGADASSCESQYEAFSLANGRPGLTQSGESGSGAGGTARGTGGGGSRETQHHSANGSSGPSSSLNNFGRNNGSRGSGSSSNGRFKIGSDGDSKKTGDTSVNNYGGGYGATNRKLSTKVRYRLDNGSVLKPETDENGRRKVASSGKSSAENSGRKARMALNNKSFTKNSVQEESTPISFAGFLKFIIIAAIIIALVMFLGGQALQIGKSME